MILKIRIVAFVLIKIKMFGKLDVSFEFGIGVGMRRVVHKYVLSWGVEEMVARGNEASEPG
jgi:hypothetical protein